MFPVLFHPMGYFAQLIQVGFAKALASLLFDDEEAAIDQDLDMEGDGLAAYVELFGDGIYVVRLPGDHIDDCSAGGVGDGLVYVTSGFHDMQVFACKYICKYLIAQIYFLAGRSGFWTIAGQCV